MCDWNRHHHTFHKNVLCCITCHKGFKMPSSRCDHMYTHRPQQYSCGKCNCIFCFPSSLQLHMITHKKSKLYKGFAPRCKKEYKWKQDLIRHVKGHEPRQHLCEDYNYLTTEKRLLKWHVLQHSDIKSYCCKTHGKKYKHYNLLNILDIKFVNFF